jgi:hypothetical protein
MSDWEDEDFELHVPTDKEFKIEELVEDTESPEETVTSWFQSSTDTSATATVTKSRLKNVLDQPPLLLIDFTTLSSGAVHNRYDVNGVNDPDQKKEMTKMCTENFVSYRDNVDLIQSGTVRSCGQSVWLDALAELRREYPGHFWAPIFPPKK